MGHTPGPWFVREPDQEERLADLAEGRPPEDMELTEVHTRGGEQVCFVMNTTPNESDNARLIAAAPKLLAALRDAYDALDYAQAQVDSETDRMHLTRCRRTIKPIIDKAEGGSE